MLIENVPQYVRASTDVRVIAGSAQAVIALQKEGYKLAVVTNQACVGKGLITLETAHQVQRFVIQHLAADGVTPIASYLCPHRMFDGCQCRKPASGMLRAAISDFGAPCSELWMIGDALTDVLAGRSVGAKTVLVRTGRGLEAEKGATKLADFVEDDLASAAARILGRLSP